MQTLLTALSDPTRRAALALIWPGGERCVCELMAHLDASQSRMSRHMKVLREAGLVLCRRDAQWVRYRRNPGVLPAHAAVVDAVIAAEHVGERDVA
ncbi:MAG: metalloregulator ArsR/SmtB family transcription factor [Paracoccaceae bacterium]|nr:metalloregulator ArsR/SmtB family transcription factor [Paracoccaceae bacterium]